MAHRDISTISDTINTVILKFTWATNKFNTLRSNRRTSDATLEQESTEKTRLYNELLDIRRSIRQAFPALSNAIEHVFDFQSWLTYPIKESRQALKFQLRIDKLINRCGNCGRKHRAAANFCGFCAAKLR